MEHRFGNDSYVVNDHVGLCDCRQFHDSLSKLGLRNETRVKCLARSWGHVVDDLHHPAALIGAKTAGSEFLQNHDARR